MPEKPPQNKTPEIQPEKPEWQKAQDAKIQELAKKLAGGGMEDKEEDKTTKELEKLEKARDIGWDADAAQNKLAELKALREATAGGKKTKKSEEEKGLEAALKYLKSKTFKKLTGEEEKPRAAKAGESREKPAAGTETLETFKNEFNISAEDLNGIAGFGDLTEGQKIYVAENLRQLTLGRIQEDAQKTYKKETAEKGVLGKMWRAASEVYGVAKQEKKTAQEIQKGGMETHGKILKELVAGAKYGPEAVRTPEGNIRHLYVSPRSLERALGRNLDFFEKSNVENINELYDKFSRMPYEWSLAGAQSGQRKEFQKVHGKYEQSKKYLLGLLEKEQGPANAQRYFRGIERSLKFSQFLNTHPDVEKELTNVKSKWAWANIRKDKLTANGIFLGAGGATRALSASFLGLACVVPAAAALGGVWWYRREKGAIAEQAKAARRGEGPGGKEIKVSTRAGREIARVRKDYVDAEKLNMRLSRLMRRLEEPQNPEKLILNSNHLKRLTEYTEAKLANGQVNFGPEDGRVVQQYNLANYLGTAQMFFVDKGYKDSMYQGLARAMDIRNKKISREEKLQLLKKAGYGAFWGAGMSTAGWYARHLTEGMGEKLFGWARDQLSGWRGTGNGPAVGGIGPRVPHIPGPPPEGTPPGAGGEEVFPPDEYRVGDPRRMEPPQGPEGTDVGGRYEGIPIEAEGDEDMPAEGWGPPTGAGLSEEELNSIILEPDHELEEGYAHSGELKGIPEFPPGEGPDSLHEPEEGYAHSGELKETTELPPEIAERLEKAYPDIDLPALTEELKAETPEELLRSGEIAPPGGIELPPPGASASAVEVVRPGDSIWKMLDRQLEARYGSGKWARMNGGQRTYLIDLFKDKVADAPKSFGLTDIDELRAGQKVDFSGLFEGDNALGDAATKAEGLLGEQIKNIEHNNDMLNDWVREHQGQKLDSEKVEEILTGKTTAGAGETAPAHAPVKTPELIPVEGEVAPPRIQVAPDAAVDSEMQNALFETKKHAFAHFDLYPDEFNAIKDVPVDYLLKTMPHDPTKAFEAWMEGDLRMPYADTYDPAEFHKQYDLAEYLRSLKISDDMKKASVKTILMITTGNIPSSQM